MPMSMMPRGVYGIATIAMVALAVPAQAQLGAAQPYDLPAQPLGSALRAVAQASGTNIIAASALVDGKMAPALSGGFTPSEAVSALLRGSGLHARAVARGFVIEADGPTAATATAEGEILVTGSRIRGAPIASPIITLRRDDMRNAGQSSLGQVVRSIPQSFSGGQNPGIGTNVPATNGVDVGGGSSINLRGLGSDATLTLLNGHRLSYSASRQSVDVSSIPLGIVDRIEIVPDGASALYGSDAVAGVANIILRRDYDGVETSLRLGTSTDGGDFEQQYGAVAGRTWNSGGVVGAYEYASNSPILAADRSFAARRSPGLTLYPEQRHHNAAVTAHQRITANLGFTVDALYNDRHSSSIFPLNAAGDLTLSGGRSFSRAKSFEVAPALRLDLPGSWRVGLAGTYGRDHIDYGVDTFAAGIVTPAGTGHYYNTTKSAELSGDGDLLRLPGGAMKLAVGGGYRSISFENVKSTATYQNITRGQDSYYAYGELSLPLVSSAQGIAFIDRLSLSAALRYENYPGIGDVLTPKLGLIFAPIPDLDIKASWGQSFRAPTLLQQYDPPSVTLSRATSRGGVGYPAAATVLTEQGGNPALRPERATSWSASIDIHPRALPGARLEVGYFSTRYRDRIVTPVTLLSVALSNPIYRNQVLLAPTDAQKAAVISAAGTFLNSAGAPYSPANVIAIVDNNNINAGRQSARGVDVLASYKTSLGGGGGDLGLSANATYLMSTQQISPGQPTLDLAGTLFNPPHVRGRVGISWADRGLNLGTYLNYTGSVRDPRFSPSPRIGAMVTADLSLRYVVPAASGLARGLELSLSLLNAFNDKPANIATSSFTDTPYDSTNYSPVGRFISMGVTKKW